MTYKTNEPTDENMAIFYESLKRRLPIKVKALEALIELHSHRPNIDTPIYKELLETGDEIKISLALRRIIQEIVQRDIEVFQQEEKEREYLDENE